MRFITVSAVVIRNAAGDVLTVRKSGTRTLMLPGGKPEPGESATCAAVREFAEELGETLVPGDLQLLGVFTAPAANETNYTVNATVFEHPYIEVRGPQAEIEHLQWVPVDAAPANLAPLLIQKIFPALRARPAHDTPHEPAQCATTQ